MDQKSTADLCVLLRVGMMFWIGAAFAQAGEFALAAETYAYALQTVDSPIIVFDAFRS